MSDISAPCRHKTINIAIPLYEFVWNEIAFSAVHTVLCGYLCFILLTVQIFAVCVRCVDRERGVSQRTHARIRIRLAKATEHVQCAIAMNADARQTDCVCLKWMQGWSRNGRPDPTFGHFGRICLICKLDVPVEWTCEGVSGRIGRHVSPIRFWFMWVLQNLLIQVFLLSMVCSYRVERMAQFLLTYGWFFSG